MACGALLPANLRIVGKQFGARDRFLFLKTLSEFAIGCTRQIGILHVRCRQPKSDFMVDEVVLTGSTNVDHAAVADFPK